MARIVEHIFEGRIISVRREEHELPNGRRALFEMVRHPGGAAVLPLLPDGRVLLIRQFRPAAGGMLWEIPAGRLDPGEDPASCVARELVEETGYQAARVEHLGDMQALVGYCDEVIHLFVATELQAAEQALEADEYIELAPVRAEEALAMVLRGEIRDGKTQLALLLARQRGII